MNFLKIDKKDLLTIRAMALWGGITVGLLALLGLAAAGAEIAYARLYADRMFPGVRLYGVRLDGMTKDEARQAVQKAVDEALGKGLRFRFRTQEVQLESTATAADPDVSHDLIHYAVDDGVEKAYAVGREGNWMRHVLQQLDARVGPVHVAADIRVEREAIEEALELSLKDLITPAKNASFSVAMTTGTTPLVHIENEKSGLTFDASEAMAVLGEQASRLAFQPITLKEQVALPTLHREDLEPLLDEMVALLKRPQLTFTYDRDAYRIPMRTLADWITVKSNDGKPRLAFDHDAVANSLRGMAPTIEQEAKNGSLVVKDGKISSFVPGTRGVALNIAETLAPLETEWPPKASFPIVVDITSGSLLGEDPERLGIKEIIGVGRSNFSGSPVNRRKNIRKGAEKVNGTIIPPGGEFSLLKTLGPVDGVNGWLPELVIKGNKTTPEFGGGLCQIGTTTFRGALDSGLKILERRNHSYRVRYYEPAGTDATIYEPSPDFRFQNDTAHHVLINAYLKGDDVIFEFWGTEDGRKASFKGQTEVTSVDLLKPRVYNVTVPPPVKLVETLELPPGQKKCTESAHNGADADFTYRVSYADGTTHEEVFASHYRPWQAVCLIGVETLSAPQDTSTNESAVN